MRFLHTADWHLGRILHGVHLTVDQAHLLDQVVDLAREAQVEAVIVAGDVYDRAVPPPDAVALLSETLGRLIRGVGVRVAMVAGNHDSPERLGFCSLLLEEQGLSVAGPLSARPLRVGLDDAEGPVGLHLVPYAEPAVVRAALSDDGIRTHDDAMRRLAARVRANEGERSVVVAHAFVSGGEESESERPLSVGGAAQVDPRSFDGFHFVALGHLHRPQEVGSPRISYAGSLMKYSFAEADHRKSVSLVELGGDGAVSVERVELAPRRDLRVLEGTLEELLAAAADDPAPDDYVMASLTDPGVVRDPMGRLRSCYPNVLHVARPGLVGEGPAPGLDPRRVTTSELFAEFIRARLDRDLSEEESRVFAEVVDDMRDRERGS